MQNKQILSLGCQSELMHSLARMSCNMYSLSQLTSNYHNIAVKLNPLNLAGLSDRNAHAYLLEVGHHV